MTAFSFSNILEQLLSGHELAHESVEHVFTQIFEGALSPVQVAAFLVALRTKGESADEISIAARIFGAHIGTFQARGNDAVPLFDTCGTGGDGACTFNISTVTAIVLAACGVRVAKHGNRAVSSRIGSADFVEALGIPVDSQDPDFNARLQRSLQLANIAFLFAPRFHSVLRNVAPIRRDLGVRTLFNLLGPLLNPAHPERQLIGVYDFHRRHVIAESLRHLGCARAWVVHARNQDGACLDEVTPSGPTYVTELREDKSIGEFIIHPEDAGLKSISFAALRGGSAETNLKMGLDILGGEECAARSAVVLNTACALMIVNRARTLKEGREQAEHAIDSGQAYQTLERWREVMTL